MSEDQEQNQDSDQWDDNTADSKQPEKIIDLGAGVVLQNPETVTVIGTPDIHDNGPPLDLAASDQDLHQDQDPDQWDNDKADSEQPAMLATPEKLAASQDIFEKGPPYDLAVEQVPNDKSSSTLIRFPRKKPWIVYILVILVVVIVGGVVAYIVAFPIGEKSNTSSSTLSPPGSEGNDSSPAAPENSISTAPTYSMSSSPSIVTPFPSASISSSPSIHVPSTSSAPTRPGTMAEIVFAQVLGNCAAGFPDACSDDEFVAMKWFYDMSNHPKDVALDEQRMAVSLTTI